jgi:repressor LexA
MGTKTDQGIMKRQEIYFFIVDYIKQHCYPPTFREIADGVNLKSTSTVQMHIDKMIASGMLESDDLYGLSRAIRVPGYKFVKE